MKFVPYVCLVIIAGLWFSSCNLRPDIIKECQAACSSINSQMKSVTPRECICAIHGLDDPWILPR